MKFCFSLIQYFKFYRWSDYLGENYELYPDVSWMDKIKVEPEGIMKGECGMLKASLKLVNGKRPLNIKVPPIMSIR